MKDIGTFSLLNAWAAAEQKGEVVKLDELIADAFLAVGPRGFVLKKEQWLGRFPNLVYDTFQILESRVVDCDKTIVFIARVKQAGSFQGHRTDGIFRISQTWIQTPGGWKIIACQYTPDNTEPPVTNQRMPQ